MFYKIINTLRSFIVSPLIKVFKKINPEWNPKYITDREMDILLDLVKSSKGAVVEIGCNEGNTLKKIAESIHPRHAIGIDYSKNTNAHFLQKTETPVELRIGIQAKHLPNVTVLDCGSQLAEPHLNQHEIGMIFIDGDHSWDGVKRDTEMALRLIEEGVIVWHDYSEYSPFFIKVWEYLKSRPDLKITRFNNANLGVLFLWK